MEPPLKKYKLAFQKLYKLKKIKLILASSSPRRKKLLKQIALKFKLVKSNINENKLIQAYRNLDYSKLVKILALKKALAASKICSSDPDKNKIVLGFDTIVVCKNKMIGKPKNKTDALKKILFLSNSKHRVYTGIGLVNLKTKKKLVDYEVTKVLFKKISRKDAINYISTKEPLDKAGAYGIQGKGSLFVKEIRGDYFNVVGLPIKRLYNALKHIC